VLEKKQFSDTQEPPSFPQEKKGWKRASRCQRSPKKGRGPPRTLGAPLREALRAIVKLDDDDLERFVPWFAQHLNRWGQTPRDNSMRPRS